MQSCSSLDPHGSRHAGVCAILIVSVACRMAADEPKPDEQINPFPRHVNRTDRLTQWAFADGTAGWRALHDCTLAAKDGKLAITSTGEDPYLHIPVRAAGGEMLLKLRARFGTAGSGQFFYATTESPNWEERKSVRFGLQHDGKWHDTDVRLVVKGTLTGLRLDPGSGPGRVEVERMELHRIELHPLEIVRLAARPGEVRAWVKNHADKPVRFQVGAEGFTAPAGGTVEARLAPEAAGPFPEVPVVVRSEGLADLRRTVWLYCPDAEAKWITRSSGSLTVRFAPDGTGAVLLRDGKAAAAIAPIVSCGGARPVLKLTETPAGVRLAGEGLAATLELADGELRISIRAEQPCDGPAVRAIGPLEQGLLAGLEYLGKGERSSSTADIETPEHVRYAPDPLKVTLPLMAVVTDRATVAVTWPDMSQRPRFACPNFFDGTDDHLMGFRGERIDATIRLGPAAPIEDAISWAVAKHGLPPLPKAPRTRRQQWDLALRSLRGPIAGEGGWGHCAEGKWARQPFADMASTIWRLTGEAPQLDRLVPGGAHVRNDAIYFVTGRAEQWLDMRRNQARGILRRQQADGSFRYAGEYRRGHFEDTASGHCARPAYELLEFARQTGDKDALAAGLKALAYMKRFRTPRGAQTWELSLHTPDVLASAYLVGAYVRGYQLTGEKAHLAEARRWALSGIPFVYLWDRYPIMRYATPPVYGATNWRAPNWIGLPVQWCGGVYAYFLTQLAPCDDTLDWRKLAEGILLAGEQMQYPDGPLLGCLPDVFYLPDQLRAGPSINPCAMVSLRLAVAGELDSLAVAADDKHRVCGPWPIALRDGKAHVAAKAGQTYQLVIDGKRVVHVEASKGSDVIDLD
ncbi:MAG TPA: hypothetical protein VM695_11075 [Phycisphaerae bacterium]|nr:hypothetical protein [Phycisphaerae bacterium]